jgi:hypothetical protein
LSSYLLLRCSANLLSPPIRSPALPRSVHHSPTFPSFAPGLHERDTATDAEAQTVASVILMIIIIVVVIVVVVIIIIIIIATITPILQMEVIQTA